MKNIFSSTHDIYNIGDLLKPIGYDFLGSVYQNSYSR